MSLEMKKDLMVWERKGKEVGIDRFGGKLINSRPHPPLPFLPTLYMFIDIAIILYCSYTYSHIDNHHHHHFHTRSSFSLLELPRQSHTSNHNLTIITRK